MTNPFPPTPSKLTQPLRSLEAWTAFFRDGEIPVLAQTAASVEALRANEEVVDANGIGESIANDPLMTLKVLAYSSTQRGSSVVTDCETVISALVMMGISPFFALFGPQPTVEESLAEYPEARAGLADTLRRAHRGANFALGFAVHRMDHDAAVIHTAALLHDFAEMLLWCHAPLLALEIRRAQLADGRLRSDAAQQSVLNIRLVDLQQSLMKAWHLPELLIQITDDRHIASSNVRNVTLALRLARHTANGWDNPAIPDDIIDIAALLNLSQAATLQLVRAI
jgi:HD-like signal output (HDOD) protein